MSMKGGEEMKKMTVSVSALNKIVMESFSILQQLFCLCGDYTIKRSATASTVRVI